MHPKTITPCRVDTCTKNGRYSGLCTTHHSRWYRNRSFEVGDGRRRYADSQRLVRFFDKVITSEDGCWIWTACTVRDGYGRVGVNGKLMLAHRYIFEQMYGPIPDGMEVCHICDNPPCVRPDHLFLGSHKDNMLDRDLKGRQARNAGKKGERSHLAKLTDAQAAEIKQSYRPRDSVFGGRALALHYGVSKATISLLVRGQTWTHV